MSDTALTRSRSIHFESSGLPNTFVIGPDGKLKSVFLPLENAFVPPKNIQKILKMYGITDIDNLGGDVTIH